MTCTLSPAKNLLLLLALLLGFSTPAMASKPPPLLVIQHSSTRDINHDDYYFRALLTLAMDKTEDTFGSYKLKEYHEWVSDKRLHASAARGDIDIIWSVTSPETEALLNAVRVPLLKNLDDYRVLLIRKGDQPRFDNIQGLHDLRQFTGGMGAHWPDTEVMKYNGLPLFTATGYGKFFKMLAAGRFDYFSRGLYQAYSDVNFYPELELQIERNVLLHYPSSYYFFVNTSNPQLAERLETGLKIAQMDGSFDELFASIPRYKWAYEELLSGKRKIIPLAHPALGQEFSFQY